MALTRAKRHLFIVGNAFVLSTEKIWSKIIDVAKGSHIQVFVSFILKGSKGGLQSCSQISRTKTFSTETLSLGDITYQALGSPSPSSQPDCKEQADDFGLDDIPPDAFDFLDVIEQQPHQPMLVNTAEELQSAEKPLKQKVRTKQKVMLPKEVDDELEALLEEEANEARKQEEELFKSRPEDEGLNDEDEVTL